MQTVVDTRDAVANASTNLTKESIDRLYEAVSLLHSSVRKTKKDLGIPIKPRVQLDFQLDSVASCRAILKFALGNLDHAIRQIQATKKTQRVPFAVEIELDRIEQTVYALADCVEAFDKSKREDVIIDH